MTSAVIETLEFAPNPQAGTWMARAAMHAADDACSPYEFDFMVNMPLDAKLPEVTDSFEKHGGIALARLHFLNSYSFGSSRQ